MYLGPKKIIEPVVFDKNKVKDEIIKIFGSYDIFKDWVLMDLSPLTPFLCDLILIKNTVQNVEFKINENSSQPYTGIERRLFQKVLAISILDKNENVSSDALKVLENMTCAHLVCDTSKSFKGFVEKNS